MADNTSKVKLDKIMNRLRARLFSHFEAMNLPQTTVEAHKKTIKDITASTWNDLSDLINEKEEC